MSPTFQIPLSKRLLTWLALAIALLTNNLVAQEESLPTYLPLSQVLVGEPALLNLQLPNQPTDNLTTTQESSLRLNALRADVIDRRIYAMNITVTSDQPGVFPIPSYQVPLPSGTLPTEEQSLEVFPTDNIQWDTYQAGSQNLRIGTVVLTPSRMPYVGETLPVTIKVLLPSGSASLLSSGYAEMNQDNVVARRFEPPYPPNYQNAASAFRGLPVAMQPRDFVYRGVTYQVLNYVTNFSPLGDGTFSLGPGKVNGLKLLVQTRRQRRGFFQSSGNTYNLEVELPQIVLKAKPLPPGAPESYNGAVGQFEMVASYDPTQELAPGDQVLVDLTISGTGNLNQLKAPILQASEDNWKIYPATVNETEEDIRAITGAVGFSQVLRPKVAITEIPSFEFSYFNPKTESYETVFTEPLPLNLAPADKDNSNGGVLLAPPAGVVPTPQMTDILGLVQPSSGRRLAQIDWLSWWHLLPAGLSLALLSIICGKAFIKFRPKPDLRKIEIQTQLKAIKSEKDDEGFLRKSVEALESNNLTQDEFTQTLAKERDEVCFQPPGEAATFQLKSSRRNEILKGLRDRLLAITLIALSLSLFLPSSLEAAEKSDSSYSNAQKAWDEKNFAGALEQFKTLAQEKKSPDLLYNIGACHYKTGDIGQAAYYFQEALALQPRHIEARQNLDFIERLQGTVPYPIDDKPRLFKFTISQLFWFFIQLGLWGLLLGILLCFAFFRSLGWRRTGITLATASTLLAILFALLFFFLEDGDQPSLAANAVVTSNKNVSVHNEPLSSSAKIIDIPPANPCHLLAERGPFSYIELPNSTRGWILTESLSKIEGAIKK